VGNGYGKLVGSTQVDELGVLESPIVLTGTLSVFRVADAVLSYMMTANPGGLSFNPLVGETNDGYLSDIRQRPVTERHVLEALTGAAGGPVAEGCVGAGTGTMALGFKAGIGTSSRVAGEFTVGVLVQSNFGGLLTVQGVQIPAPAKIDPPGGSCMIVVATDAPLDSRQLGRIARRAVFAMGRVGASYSGGSGDYAIAFSTAFGRQLLPDNRIDPLFTATLDATEEALLNSLVAAKTTVGVRGRIGHALPHELLRGSRVP
jgi:D-aminopeptidase